MVSHLTVVALCALPLLPFYFAIAALASDRNVLECPRELSLVALLLSLLGSPRCDRTGAVIRRRGVGYTAETLITLPMKISVDV